MPPNPFRRPNQPSGRAGRTILPLTRFVIRWSAELDLQLESGKSLAQVAKDRGKSVDGLIQALVDQATKRLDADVASGRLTKAQEQQILSGLKQRITDFVNGLRERGYDFRFDRGFAGPPSGPGYHAA